MYVKFSIHDHVFREQIFLIIDFYLYRFGVILRLTDDVNECLENPCENGATCENTEGSFNCHCVDGWTGDKCDGKLLVTFLLN